MHYHYTKERKNQKNIYLILPISLYTLRFISVNKLLWSSIILLEDYSGKKSIAHQKTQARTKACVVVFYSFNCCAISFLPPLDSEWGSFYDFSNDLLSFFHHYMTLFWKTFRAFPRKNAKRKHHTEIVWFSVWCNFISKK